jgi:hypothetical protein
MVVAQADREGDSARLMLAGQFDLHQAVTTAREIASIEASLDGCRVVELDLAGVDDIDGAGSRAVIGTNRSRPPFGTVTWPSHSDR